MKPKLKVQDRVAIYESIGLTLEQALKVDELLLTELARQREEISKKYDTTIRLYSTLIEEIIEKLEELYESLFPTVKALEIKNSKLKVTDVDKIRAFHKAGFTQKDIAKTFSVRPQTIGQIVREETWNG